MAACIARDSSLPLRLLDPAERLEGERVTPRVSLEDGSDEEVWCSLMRRNNLCVFCERAARTPPLLLDEDLIGGPGWKNGVEVAAWIAVVRLGVVSDRSIRCGRKLEDPETELFLCSDAGGV